MPPLQLPPTPVVVTAVEIDPQTARTLRAGNFLGELVNFAQQTS